jgi:hypothetical protein
MDWPATTSGNRFSDIGTSATSAGTLITAGATNVKSGWIQLVAAAPCGASGITIMINNPVAGTITRIIDVGVGASGFELVVIPNILVSSAIVDSPIVVYFPIRIPNGARVAMRMAASTASTTVTASVILHTTVWGTQVPNQRIVDYGTVAASSRGTTVTANTTTANTEGAWVVLSASTTEACRGLIIGVGNGLNSTRTVTTAWLIDVGIGAAAAEQVLIPNYVVRGAANKTVEPNLSPVFPVSFPAGSRLCVRAQSNVTTINALDVVVYSIV